METKRDCTLSDNVVVMSDDFTSTLHNDKTDLHMESPFTLTDLQDSLLLHPAISPTMAYLSQNLVILLILHIDFAQASLLQELQVVGINRFANLTMP